MLFPRLVKRFLVVLICVVLVLLLINATLAFPPWIYLLSLPAAGFLTFLYWQSFKGTTICPTCNGTGKIQVRHGREVETDLCYSCDGEGRVSVRR
jgi:hypothetical protein